MSPQARMAAGTAPLPEAGVSGDGDAGAGPFVINLTSSTTPMALSHPDSPELKRFSFFVSRRREDNRERFRLHMGYFSTLAEAEEWLNVIRDLYPGAWAGEAPGKKLRARAAAADLAKQLPAPPPVPASAAPTSGAAAASRTSSAPKAPPARAPQAAASAGVARTEIEVPTLQAAPTFAPAPQAAVPASAAPMLEAVAQAAAALAAVAKTAMAQTADHTVMAPNPFVSAPINQAAPAHPTFAPAPAAPVVAAQPPRAPARPAAPSVSVSAQPVAPRAPVPPPKPAAAAAKGAKKNPANALTDGSNVREVMASLDETGETRRMQIPPGLRAPVAPSARPAAASASSPVTAPAARPVGAARPPSAPAQGIASSAPSNLAHAGAQNAAQAAARGPRSPSAASAAEKPRTLAAPPPPARVPDESMSDTQVLRMLEVRRSDEDDKGSDDANAGISLLKPDDTQTRRALKEAVLDNAPVSFAVQLQWSVQPVELDKVPPLAIFSAYTLYTVEGSREGRKWYGLRLGFFSDAISAKQVAYYVRSEFTSVAVVPVSPGEKARASDEETKAASGAFQRKHTERKTEEFKLFDDEQPAAASEPPRAPEAPAKAAAAAPRAPARKNKPLGRVKAKEQRSPKTLEETLEILGASDLEIDNGRGETLNDTGVRHLRVEVQKNTPFAKLLDRISERVRKN